MGIDLLIIDDDDSVRASLKRIAQRAGHEVTEAAEGESGIKLYTESPPDLVLLDLQMPGRDGLSILRELREINTKPAVVMISGTGTIEIAVEAVRLGAQDFVEKPITPERATVAINNAIRFLRLQNDHEEVVAQTGDQHVLVGQSQAMQDLRSLIGRAAPSEGRVLVTGENGTGKELIARNIHSGSARAAGPFVAVNCASVPATLFESELFGHEKGAFTGASARRKGKFEQADGGSIFLDEVGELPIDMQPKLLRVLQEGEIQRVGSDKSITVDVRVIAATNRSLPEMIEAGTFREDLFYRINVLPICAPPLRDRAGDIEELSRGFLEIANRRNSRSVRIGDEAIEELRRHSFPGNVRELQNLIERLVILSPRDDIVPSVLKQFLKVEPDDAPKTGYIEGMNYKEQIDRAQTAIINGALEAFQGNVSAAATALGLERSHFYKKMKALGIK